MATSVSWFFYLFAMIVCLLGCLVCFFFLFMDDKEMGGCSKAVNRLLDPDRPRETVDPVVVSLPLTATEHEC